MKKPNTITPKVNNINPIAEDSTEGIDDHIVSIDMKMKKLKYFLFILLDESTIPKKLNGIINA